MNINRILKRFQREDTPELVQYISGVNETPTATIDDGAAYDPQTRTTPEWVQKDLSGWV